MEGPVSRPQEQSGPLQLAEALSYDELVLSALVGLSCPTRFINAGDRGNMAKPGACGTFEEEGIYVGLVGARFERRGRMEWAHMLLEPEQNVTSGGYGPDAVRASGDTPAAKERALLLRAWARFYGLEALPTYVEAMADASGRFHPLPHTGGQLLDL